MLIKLHSLIDLDQDTWFNTLTIQRITRDGNGGTVVWTGNGEQFGYWVKETPEEIAEMFKESNGSNST